MLTDERAALALAPAPVGTSVDAVTAHPGTPPRLGGSSRGPLLGWTALVVLPAGFGLDQLRALRCGRLATNEDQTLLWFAGRELLRFHLHQPNFYGQNYNTVFEAVPGQLLQPLGVSGALANRPVKRILIQGWIRRTLSARTGACRAERRGMVLLTTPSQPASVSLVRTDAVLRIP